MINEFLGAWGDGPDPIFETEEEHNDYYINKILNKYKLERPSIYNEYFRLLNSGDKEGALSMIAVLGGIPKWQAPARKPQTPGLRPPGPPSNIAGIGFKPPSVGGYRYNVGPGRPALGSITNRRRRRRPY